MAKNLGKKGVERKRKNEQITVICHFVVLTLMPFFCNKSIFEIISKPVFV